MTFHTHNILHALTGVGHSLLSLLCTLVSSRSSLSFHQIVINIVLITDGSLPVLVPPGHQDVDNKGYQTNDRQDEVIPEVTILGWTNFREREYRKDRCGHRI